MNYLNRPGQEESSQVNVGDIMKMEPLAMGSGRDGTGGGELRRYYVRGRLGIGSPEAPSMVPKPDAMLAKTASLRRPLKMAVRCRVAKPWVSPSVLVWRPYWPVIHSMRLKKAGASSPSCVWTAGTNSWSPERLLSCLW